MQIEQDEVHQAIARGWCTKENETKTMDPDLAQAIGKEVWALIIRKMLEEN